MDASAFAQIDLLHWILDMNSLVSDAYRDVRKLCVFLLPVAASSFPPGKALTVYFQPLGHPFLFCDAVHPARTSSLLSLPWPDPSEEPPIPDPNPNPLQLALTSAKIGISVEDLASLPPVAYAVAEKKVERLALRVGENLFNFMQSFCGIDGSRLVVPMDILDRWFKKFQERARKDPNGTANLLLQHTVLWKVAGKLIMPKPKGSTSEIKKASSFGLKWSFSPGTNLLSGGAAKLEKEFRKKPNEFSKELRTFRSVDLSGHNFGDDGLFFLAESLGYNQTLKEEVDFSGNGITAVGLKALDGVLQMNTMLKTLNLSGNNIGDEGAKEFTQSRFSALCLASSSLLPRKEQRRKNQWFLSGSI
ncbi:hypothetical protein ZIOFF_051404 [Zingiber officinale]|uniref:Hikeshi-like C-terminal domain-containing protein n=1 Tax=Zingiber officinale TaxID=94328 RepID=A0A8J5FTE5_ZINOF|nr:hypothetical protein ZIOFF_051404 [Zingiber officinale]